MHTPMPRLRVEHNTMKGVAMTIAASDIELGVEQSQIASWLRSAVSYHSQYPDISRISSTAIDISSVVVDSMPQTQEQAIATSRWVLRSYQWISSFMDKSTKYGIDPKWDGKHTHAGITYEFKDSQLNELFRVRSKAVFRELSQYFNQRPSANSNYLQFVLADDRYSDTYIGDPSNGILERASWLAKRKAISSLLSRYMNENVDNGERYWYAYNSDITLAHLKNIMNAMEVGYNHKPDAHTLFSLRSELLDAQASAQRRSDHIRRVEASKKFNAYWTNLKDSRPAQSPADAAASWAEIPLLPAGVGTSRTWGIEIETVRAQSTSRPAGWDSRYDGSLPGSEGYCDCDCDDCYNGNHCNDADYSCHDDDDVEAREFVSPVLSHYNSAGLRQLCADLGTRDDESSAPGIHVHVGVDDLTVFDVTRLLMAYSAVSRLIDPILHRKTYNYCHEMSTDQLRWWLGKLREWQRTNPERVPSPTDIIYSDMREAAPNRYVDVNLHALTAHGTIEFRSMGAWYDYEHLVRWAWFVRELVNVSKLGIDQREWTSCKSLTDVTNLLRKYGSELPDSQLFADKAPAIAELIEE